MDCDQMLQLINHYMDGGLSQWRTRAVTKHIDDCPPCAEHHLLYVRCREVVATKCSETAPEGLRLRISEALGSITVDNSPLDLV